MLDRIVEGDDRLVLTFFFDFSDATKQTVDDMLRSLAFQLYKRQTTVTTLDALFQAHQNGRSQPSIKTLSDVVSKMLVVYPRVAIILDALDESTTRSELLQWINVVASGAGQDIQLLCTSRPESEFLREIPLAIGEENCISLDKQAIDEDIRSYVAAELTGRRDFQAKRLSPDLLEKIRKKVGDEADGM